MQLLPIEMEIKADSDRMLNELRIAKRLGAFITRKIKAVWTKLKRAIVKVFKTKIKKVELFDTVEITIPAQVKEDIMKDMNMLTESQSGAIGAIKGNYNEALVCQFLFNHKGQEVDISTNYEKYRGGISQTVSEWDKKLKAADVKNYTKNIGIIRKGSADMANYLISAAVNEKATIVGAYLDNLAFMDGIDFKADIRVAVMKEGKEILDSYSLKLYSNKVVGLANTTARGLCGHLAGSKAEAQFDKVAKADSELSNLINISKKINAIKQDFKTHLKGIEKGTINLRKLRGLSDDEISKLDLGKLDADRKAARKPINKRIAQLVYNVLKDYEGSDEMGENILNILGFNDKDTKMLMAITTLKKSEIIAHHPDLDLSNITVEDPKGRVSINILGPQGRRIVSFNMKEGEQKKVSGSVSFAGIEPEEYDKYL